jgi:hypothetical protein
MLAVPEQAERRRQLAAARDRLSAERPRTAPSSVLIHEENWRSLNEALQHGFLEGLDSTLDPFGERELTFFKYLPNRTDSEALRADWEVLSVDFRAALEAIKNEVVTLLIDNRLASVPDDQPALFDPDTLRDAEDPSGQ